MRLVVLASGAGTTFEFLVRESQKKPLGFQVVGLVCDRIVPALDKAKSLQVPAKALIPKEFSGFEAWDQKMSETIRSLKPDAVLAAGFLRRIGPEVLKAFPNRIFNTHPSLLPKFGGAGMYGHHVHKAVWEAKETETGITLHVVSAEYDDGPVIAQRRISCKGLKSAEEIEELVKQNEKEFLLESLKEIAIRSAQGKL